MSDTNATDRPKAITPDEQAQLQAHNQAVDDVAQARALYLQLLQAKYKGAQLLGDGRLRWPQQPTP
jgi:hypothetical protein